MPTEGFRVAHSPLIIYSLSIWLLPNLATPP
jgi:hypothetical protein